MSFIEADLVERRLQRRLQRLTGKSHVHITDSESFDKLRKQLDFEYMQKLSAKEIKLLDLERKRLDRLIMDNVIGPTVDYDPNDHHPNGPLLHDKCHANILYNDFRKNPAQTSQTYGCYFESSESDQNDEELEKNKESSEIQNGLEKPVENQDELFHNLKRPYTARIAELQRAQKVNQMYEAAEKVLHEK